MPAGPGTPRGGYTSAFARCLRIASAAIVASLRPIEHLTKPAPLIDSRLIGDRMRYPARRYPASSPSDSTFTQLCTENPVRRYDSSSS